MYSFEISKSKISALKLQTSTNVNGRLARTEFFNHFSDFFLIQQIHMN